MIKNEEPKDTLSRYRRMYKATKSLFVHKLLTGKAKELTSQCLVSAKDKEHNATGVELPLDKISQIV